MKRQSIIFSVMVLLLAPICSGYVVEKKVELYVSAAASLKDALEEIQPVYQSKNPQIRLNYSFASSGALQTQIEQGAPADIFFSAAEKQMNNLEAKNLIIKNTRRNMVRNELVVILPKNSSLPITKFTDLANNFVKRIAIGATVSVPAGQYAKQSFNAIGIWEQVESKLIFATNVRSVLTYVETGNVDAGLVYRTDTVVSDRVKIVAAAPDGTHEPIIYPAAVLSGSKQPEAAKAFLNYLSSIDGLSILSKYGFVAY